MFVVLVLLRGALHCKLASLSGLITAYALITAIFFLSSLSSGPHTVHGRSLTLVASDKWWTDYAHAFEKHTRLLLFDRARGRLPAVVFCVSRRCMAGRSRLQVRFPRGAECSVPFGQADGDRSILFLAHRPMETTTRRPAKDRFLMCSSR